jgi:hypothetical protein
MEMKETLAEKDIAVSQYEYDGAVELVADFGIQHDEHVEIVGDTAIIMVDGTQYEIALDGDAQAFMNNGVVTIEVEE